MVPSARHVHATPSPQPPAPFPPLYPHQQLPKQVTSQNTVGQRWLLL